MKKTVPCESWMPFCTKTVSKDSNDDDDADEPDAEGGFWPIAENQNGFWPIAEATEPVAEATEPVAEGSWWPIAEDSWWPVAEVAEPVGRVGKQRGRKSNANKLHINIPCEGWMSWCNQQAFAAQKGVAACPSWWPNCPIPSAPPPIAEFDVKAAYFGENDPDNLGKQRNMK